LGRIYAALFPVYRQTREALLPVWSALVEARRSPAS
jgi:hypothetical protein